MLKFGRGPRMTLGVIYNKKVSNASYRALWPAIAMARRGHRLVLAEQDASGRLDHRELLSCDVVHVYRTADRTILEAVEALRARGIAITFDNDDDVRLAPRESPNYKHVGGVNGQRLFRAEVALMRRADVVTTTTEPLAARIREAHDGVVQVIPNFLGAEQLVGPGRRDPGVVTIGWVAGREHVADARRLKIENVLREVLDGEASAEVVTFGVRLNLPAARYSHDPFVPMPELPRRTSAFDIGIAPLADIPMSYVRSDVKVKEYSAAGVPWVASARGPYAALGPGQGGALVGDDEWAEALIQLVRDPRRRAGLQAAAGKWAKAQQIDRNVDLWADAWREAIARAGRRGEAPAASLAAVRGR
jgi:Glycosyl transferases group 1